MALLNAAGTLWTQPWFLVSDTHGSINQDDSKNAFDASIAGVGGVPYVVWLESDGTNLEVRVAHRRSTGFTPPTWVQPWAGASATSGAINVSTTRSAGPDPDLVPVGGIPHVAWIEPDGLNDEVRVKRLNAAGTTWETPPAGDDINDDPGQNAQEPSLADVGGTLFIAWSERDGSDLELRVKRLGEDWEEPWPGASATDGKVEHNPTKDARSPSIASIDGVPYVAYLERNGTDALRVARLDATTRRWSEPWVGVSATSGGLNQDDNKDAQDPSLASIGGVPYVAWRESDGNNIEMRVARLNTATNQWEQVVGGPSPINHDPGKDTFGPSLAVVGSVPYVAWQEDDYDIRASRLEPEFTAQSATPSPNGVTLSAGLHTYGIPYSVGFQVGGALENETATQTTPSGSENAAVSQQVGGLDPETTYQFRPFATAGVPAPRVFGASGSFTTLATGPNGAVPGAAAPPGTAPGAIAPPADTTPPSFIGSTRAVPTTFALNPRGRRETAVRSRVRRGTTFRYALSEPGRVVFTIERKARGRRVGRRCRRQTGSNRRRRACTRFVRVGAFAQQAVAARNSKRFSGRIGRKKLSPGSYRATLVATDAAGNASRPRRVVLKVVSR